MEYDPGKFVRNGKDSSPAEGMTDRNVEYPYKHKKTKKELILLKRAAAICLALVLLLCCTAGAEQKNVSSYDFEDFTYQGENPLTYQGKKGEEPILFTYAVSTAGIAMAMVNAAWAPEQTARTPEEFTEDMKSIEPVIRAQYESGGYVLQSFVVEDAVEKEYWGQPVLQCDAVLQVRIADAETVLKLRNIQITGSFGTYSFSVSAWSSEVLEEACEGLVQAIQWK